MSMRLIAALACCTLAMGMMTGCNKSSKSGSAGAMQQCKDHCGGKCDGKCDGTQACCKEKAASMGAVKGDCCKDKAGAACTEKKDGAMGAVSGQGACGAKGSCSGKAGC